MEELIFEDGLIKSIEASETIITRDELLARRSDRQAQVDLLEEEIAKIDNILEQV